MVIPFEGVKGTQLTFLPYNLTKVMENDQNATFDRVYGLDNLKTKFID